MGQTKAIVAQAKITLNGTPYEASIMNKLASVEVDLNLDLPGMFVLRFHDEGTTSGLSVMADDETNFPLGGEVEISFPGSSERTDHGQPGQGVIKGEITAIEPEFGEDMNSYLVVRGYNKLHRLNRGTKTAVYPNMSDGDILSRLAGEAGVSQEFSGSATVHPYLVQDTQTPLEFLQERARLSGCEIVYEDNKVKFRKRQSPADSGVTLSWGENLLTFNPRLTLARQVDKVTVRSWDRKQKQKIDVTVSNSSSAPQTPNGQFGGSVAQSKLTKAAEQIETRQPFLSDGEAQIFAQELLDEINAEFFTAEGMAIGDGRLLPGKKVTIEKVGTRFAGSYVVTSVQHIYNPEEGYRMIFTVGGKYRSTMLDVLEGKRDLSTHRWTGVYPAVVTNIKDEENIIRFKVKFPWFNETLESDWARIIGPGGGNNHGIQWMPEVGEEVLVAFEQGNFNYPYILGGLWNSQDAAPEPQFHAGGSNVEKRTFMSRVGHVMRFTDQSGQEKIEIYDGQNKVKIIMDAANSKITIESAGDIDIISTGNTNIKATGNIKAEATGNVDIKGTGPVKVESSATIDVKASGMATVQASGVLTLKGSAVQIG